MIKEIKLPEVSDNVETGDVLKVLVNVGDEIKVDQPLVELETDKATFEVPSTESGTVKEINVKEGDTIRIGAVILKVETNGAEEKKEADTVKMESTPKQEEIKTEEVKTEVKASEKISESERANSKDTIKEIPVNKNSAPASPSVRRLARELGVDINFVTGSSNDGRITEDDIKNFVKTKLSSGNIQSSPIHQKPLPDFSKWGEVEIQPMTKIRAVTGEAMTYAWTTVPMVTQFDKADVTQLEEFRKKNLKKVEEAGGHLTITSILVKVSEAALKQFPQFNSSIDLQKKEVVYKKYFNIGVAADTDRGLLVPVIKNVDKKTITEISIELKGLSEKARNKKITLEEMDGGNFTISNLGGIGGTNFTPIVYSPQVAILGVSRGSKEAVFVNDKFEPRLMLPLTLTYDHRIIDGADAARFLRWMCEALENSFHLIL